MARKNRDGYTPAHVAVKKLKLGLLEALIEAGAPVDLPDNNGETPLLTALNMNDSEAASLLAQVFLFPFQQVRSFKYEIEFNCTDLFPGISHKTSGQKIT